MCGLGLLVLQPICVFGSLCKGTNHLDRQKPVCFSQVKWQQGVQTVCSLGVTALPRTPRDASSQNMCPGYDQAWEGWS